MEMRSGIVSCKYQLIYFTPESLLLDKKWRNMLKGLVYEERLKALVFDEAHCIKNWYVWTWKQFLNLQFCYCRRGESFTETFLRVGEICSFVCPAVKVMALTVIISQSSRKHVQKVLQCIL